MGLDYGIQVAINYANSKTGWDAWFNDVDFFDVAVSGVISGVTAGYGATLNAGGKISKFGQFVMSNQGWIKAGEIALTSAVDITGEGAQPVTFDQFKNRVSIAAFTWGATEVVSNIFSPSKTPTLEQNVDNSIEKARKSLEPDFGNNSSIEFDIDTKDLYDGQLKVNPFEYSTRDLGVSGEKALNIKGPKSSIKINGRTRFPDRLTKSTLEEIKNVKHLSFTSQLKDFYDYAAKNKLKMIIYTRSNTTFSKPLQQMFDSNKIIHGIIPGM